MPEYFNDRKKGKHLSIEERYEIQRGLREKRNFVVDKEMLTVPNEKMNVCMFAVTQ